jgi:hypothetical protein
VSGQELLEETSLFSCSPEAVKQLAGPKVRMALNKIETNYDQIIDRGRRNGLSPVIDVRVHRLFPGMFPGIPGWHCDFVPRGAYSGQPNFGLVHPHAFLIALLLSDQPQGVSNTEFVNHPIRPQLWDQEHVYKNLHDEVVRVNPHLCLAHDNHFVWFNQKSIHRAKAAHRRGVRLFMRYSMIEKPVIVNKITHQQQVYLLSEATGW